MFKKVITTVLVSAIVLSSITFITKAAITSEQKESVVSGLYYDKGCATFNSSNGTLTFTKSGTILDPSLKTKYSPYEKKSDLPLDAWYKVFTVPSTVKKIVINKDVTVTGRFILKNNCTIEGVDAETSKLYGTSQTRYSHNRGDSYGAQWDKPWEYSSIDVKAECIVDVNNLRVEDPFGYCISGYASGAVINCIGVTMIDTRPGDQNNSDGFVGQDGSSLEDCNFEVADDAIKIYHNISITNCDIKMLKNGAPLQIGWGSDENQDTKVNIEGLNVTTDSDTKSHNLAVITWVSGSNTKTVDITANNVNINAPNADLFRLNPSNGTVNVKMTNTTYTTKSYGTVKSKGNISIKKDGGAAPVTSTPAVVFDKEDTTQTTPSTLTPTSTLKCESVYGKPVIDGNIDAKWRDTSYFFAKRVRLGSTDAYAKYRMLWDEKDVYLLVQVITDKNLNATNSQIWNNDAVEFFVDPDNAKYKNSSGYYDANDRHIIINCNNKKQAFDKTNKVDDVVSVVKKTSEGYNVEVKIPVSIALSANNVIGFDGQIDSTNGSNTRQAIVGWAGYQNIADKGPTSWGDITLKK